MSQKPLVLFGAGPFAARMRFYFEHDGGRHVAGFTVHESFLETDTLGGLDCVAFETITDRFPPDQFDLFVAVGFSGQNAHRQRVMQEALAKGYQLANYVAPSSSLADVILPGNCALMENSVLGFSSSIGMGGYIGPGTVIGHHSRLGTACYFGGNATVSGNVEIGDRVFFGTGVSTADGITIASDSFVGVGSVVARPITRSGVYFGNPARFVRSLAGASG